MGLATWPLRLLTTLLVVVDAVLDKVVLVERAVLAARSAAVHLDQGPQELIESEKVRQIDLMWRFMGVCRPFLHLSKECLCLVCTLLDFVDSSSPVGTTVIEISNLEVEILDLRLLSRAFFPESVDDAARVE